MTALIGTDKKEVALTEMVDVPCFVRFDTVKLAYSAGSQAITEKCESFRD